MSATDGSASRPGTPQPASPLQPVTPQPAAPWLVLGLGNTILRDDGVGIKVARHIAALNSAENIVVKEAELAGFALIDLLEGFERAIVIDAVRLDGAEPGEVVVFESGLLQPSLHLVAGHQIDMPTALEMGRRMGRPVPSVVYVVGVQIEDDCTFDEECTAAVEAAIPDAARAALDLIHAAS